MTMLTRLFSTALFIVFIGISNPAGAETLHCTECGMMVDSGSKFSAKIVQGQAAMHFCDIGDMFSYIKRKGLRDGTLSVKDYSSGDPIDAKSAVYVRNEKKFSTPMGWGIAAFREKDKATPFGTPLDYEALSKNTK